MQGYLVEVAKEAAEAALLALGNPPAAVVADLWMPSISGVQLCRLLKAEAATEHVPVILRGPEGQRNRFWADRAGAAAYVVRGRIGDLVRSLERSIATAPASDDFFTYLQGAGVDVRDRIAAHLDAALFDSVIASEVRALATCGDFERLFDLFSQLIAQIPSYRWLSLESTAPRRLGLHTDPTRRERSELEARLALSLPDDVPVIAVEDEDARGDEAGPAALVEPVLFGGETIGHVALAACEPSHLNDRRLVQVLAREIAGPLRIVSLLEESRRQATTDGLTGLLNRRAFLAALHNELARSQRNRYPVSIALLDADLFKQVNDLRGHATGDAVLSALGRTLRAGLREIDIVARWGGEEFVIAFSGTDLAGAEIAAERIRRSIESLVIQDGRGERVPVTVSIGLAEFIATENMEGVIDRADRAMYAAKSSGRNRVCASLNEPPAARHSLSA